MTSRRSSIVVLASGRGSNFDSILQSIRMGELSTEIRGVISDRPNALVLEKAKTAGIPHFSIPVEPARSDRLAGSHRSYHEGKILEVIDRLDPQFVVLAGYMRILTSQFIDRFRCDKGYSRMVNIHPSLLPAFPGVHSYRQAFRHGVKVTGVTVHLVEPQMDSGPICAQEAFSIDECRSELEVEEKGLKVEHRLYPATLTWLLQEKWTLKARDGGRHYVCQN